MHVDADELPERFERCRAVSSGRRRHRHGADRIARGLTIAMIRGCEGKQVERMSTV
jgi:hypothetical protein